MATVFDDLVRARIKHWQTSAAVYHVPASSCTGGVLKYEVSYCVLAGWTGTPKKISMTEDRFKSLENLFSTEAVKKNGLEVLNRFDVFNLAVFEVIKALCKLDPFVMSRLKNHPSFEECKSIGKLIRFAINFVFHVCSVEIDSDGTLSMETFYRIAQFYFDQSNKLTTLVLSELSMNHTWYLLETNGQLGFAFQKVPDEYNCFELPLEKILKLKKPKSTQEQTELANAQSRSLFFRKGSHHDLFFIKTIEATNRLSEISHYCRTIPVKIKSSTQNYLNLLDLVMKALGMPCLYKTYGNHELTTRLAFFKPKTERVIKIDKFRGRAHFCWNQLCFFP